MCRILIFVLYFEAATTSKPSLTTKVTDVIAADLQAALQTCTEMITRPSKGHTEYGEVEHTSCRVYQRYKCSSWIQCCFVGFKKIHLHTCLSFILSQTCSFKPVVLQNCVFICVCPGCLSDRLVFFFFNLTFLVVVESETLLWIHSGFCRNCKEITTVTSS